MELFSFNISLSALEYSLLTTHDEKRPSCTLWCRDKIKEMFVRDSNQVSKTAKDSRFKDKGDSRSVKVLELRV